MYENKRAECYTQLKNLIQGQDISECSLLINKIKEYRHSKIKGKPIHKFDRLLKKYNGYHHKFGTFSTWQRHIFGGHPHNTNCTNVQESSVTISATTTTTAAIAPTTKTTSSNTSVPAHTHLSPKTSGSSTYPPPPHPITGSPSSQGTQLYHSAQVPPMDSYIAAVEEACTRLLPREAEDLRAESSCLLKKNCCPFPNLISHWRK